MQSVTRDSIECQKIKLDGGVLGIIGGVGSGKTILVQNYAYQARRMGSKVIYITEKHDSAMENAFMCIDKLTNIQEKKLDLLKVPKTERYPEKVDIYHPFTFNFPQFKVPENLHLYSFPIKDISPSSYAALLNRNEKSPASMLCKRISKILDDEDTIFTFMGKIKERCGKKDFEEEFEEEEDTFFGYNISAKASKSDVNHIFNSFSILQEHYCIHSSQSETNLDEKKWKEIIQNQESITIFTQWKIPKKDKNVKYFIYIELLQKIRKYIHKYAKTKVVLIIEELLVLLPRNPEKGTIEYALANLISNIIAGIRSSGVKIIGTSQSYSEVNQQYIATIPSDKLIIMKLNTLDLRNFCRDHKIKGMNYDSLVSLGIGEYVIFKDLPGDNKLAFVYMTPHIPFANREVGYGHFIKEFSKRYPDRLISHKNTIKIVRDKFNQELKDVKKLMREQDKKKREYKKKKDIEKASSRKAIESVSSEELARRCYEHTLLYPEMSWQARTLMFDKEISRTHFTKMTLQHALRIEDYEFVRNHSSKAFITSNFNREEAETVFNNT